MSTLNLQRQKGSAHAEGVQTEQRGIQARYPASISRITLVYTCRLGGDCTEEGGKA